MNRRDFIKSALTGGASLLAPRLYGFDPVSIENPLGVYPSRDWEQVYRDQYRYDATFTWVCGPNDTHMCRLRALCETAFFSAASRITTTIVAVISMGTKPPRPGIRAAAQRATQCNGGSMGRTA